MKTQNFGQKSPALSLHRSMFILQQKHDSLLLTSAGVGLSQVRIMGELHQVVPRSQKTVSTMLHQTEANVSRQLQQMKKQGLVSIVKNSKDRRVREVTLTSKGSKIFENAKSLLESEYKILAKSGQIIKFGYDELA